MTSGIIYEGFFKSEIYTIYKNEAYYQPVYTDAATTQYLIAGIYYNNSALESNYPFVPEFTIPPDEFLSGQYVSTPLERTYHGIYILSNGIGTGPKAAYYGEKITVVIGDGQLPPTYPPVQVGEAYYTWEWFFSYISKAQLYRYQVLGYIDHPKPYYADLVDGYFFDSRILPPRFPMVIPTKTESTTIGYYKKNHLESVPNLTSIDWVEYRLELKKKVPVYIPLEACVLGTFYIIEGSSQLVDLLSSLSTPSNSYSYSDLFPTAISNLFSAWDSISKVPPVTPEGTIIQAHTTRYNETKRELSYLGANNNYWNNDGNFIGNMNSDRFLADDDTAYQWHIIQQPEDKGLGNLIMDSPRTIEIHKALDAGKFAFNPLEPSEPRVTNLGHLIEKVAALMGYRPKENGEYIIEEEKERVRRSVKDSERVDEKEYGGNYFASEGMLINRLPNSFDRKGEVVSGGVSMVHDLPQLIAEIQDQLNIALGLQESGAIAIKDGDRTYRYPNQLALFTDVVLSVASIHQLTHQTYISSLVTQQQTGEIIGGLGLPTVNRSTNIAINNKLQQIPYWGIAPQHSLARKIDTVAYNVGIVTGQVV